MWETGADAGNFLPSGEDENCAETGKQMETAPFSLPMHSLPGLLFRCAMGALVTTYFIMECPLHFSRPAFSNCA